MALNCSIFAVTFPAYHAADQAIEDLLDDESFVATNGLLFASTMDAAREPASVRELALRGLDGSEEARILLGHLALRRANFVREQTRMASKVSKDQIGDLVAFDHWKQKARRLLAIQKVHPSYRLGLSDGHSGIPSWFSYQVAHSGFTHLFWNMIFLLLFGTFVEHSRGGRAMFLTTWAGGFGGALMYSLLSGLSASPLVGASAAVSALIAISASNTSRRLPFVYWLLPMKGYYGVAWLPAWVLIPAFVLPDLSGYLAAQPGLSAVAYTAHIGGALVGFGLSYIFKEKPEAFVELAQGVTGTAASSSRFAASIR